MATAAELARIDAYVACALTHFTEDRREYAIAGAYVLPGVCGGLPVHVVEHARKALTARLPGFRVRIFTNGEAYAFRKRG